MEQVWNLDTIFSGGSGSKELINHLDQLDTDLAKLSSLPLSNKITLAQKLSAELEEAEAYILCLNAQNTQDRKAQQWQSNIASYRVRLLKEENQINEALKNISDEQFDDFIKIHKFEEIRFPLEERRHLSQKKLSLEKESLIENLAIDGYHGWSDYYDTLSGQITFNLNGKTLTQGQIENLFSHPSKKVRNEAFEAYKKSFEEKETLFGGVLNHLGGFRLKVYEARHSPSILDEPLDLNRLSEKSLTAMWQAIEDNLDPLLSYMERKAELLGESALSWVDLEAPLKGLNNEISFEESSQFIIKHFKQFSPKMAAFAEKALLNGWVEAENRPQKRHGGFCINFPLKKETRIFMTYSNTMTNVSTLAHELGHGFHAECCFSLPPYAQHYRMNVAETASTMAEMIIIDAAISEAKDQEEKIALLDDKISRSLAFLMNMRARFLFETRFYEERKKGFLSPQCLSKLMLEAQKEAFKGGLESYHPHFWASKLHFYFTDVPFYNFPYTFGYLFSLALYALFKKEPQNKEERYIALLRESAVMTTEELAEKHFGVDIKTPEFWQNALALIAKDIEEFLEITIKKEEYAEEK